MTSSSSSDAADSAQSKIAEFDRLLRTKLEPELARVESHLRHAQRECDAWHALQAEFAQCAAHPDRNVHVDVGSGVYVPVRVHSGDDAQVLLDVGLGWLVQFHSPAEALPTVQRLATDAEK
jgi:prefoldin subunit 5